VLGAYLAYALSLYLGFWAALLLAPLALAALGALVERCLMRRMQTHLAEMLMTFALAILMLEGVQLVWGNAPVDYRVPSALEGAWLQWAGVSLPTYRLFIMAVALLVLSLLALVLRSSRLGLVLKAALTHAPMVQALGHDVPRLFTAIFALGCGLAGLAGALGGNAFVTEPGMAATLGSVLFVVIVVGGLGSLGGALLACLLIGCLQTLAIGLDGNLGSWLGLPGPLAGLKLSQLAPLLPYALMVLVLVLRPRGLMGQRP
jgi:branched-chain amino acid transport system permease protein